MITLLPKQIIKGPQQLRIELNADEIFLDDPGMGTPVLVSVPIDYDRATASFNCALEQGEVDGNELTDEQKNFLEEIAYQIDTWLTNYTRAIRNSLTNR